MVYSFWNSWCDCKQLTQVLGLRTFYFREVLEACEYSKTVIQLHIITLMMNKQHGVALVLFIGLPWYFPAKKHYFNDVKLSRLRCTKLSTLAIGCSSNVYHKHMRRKLDSFSAGFTPGIPDFIVHLKASLIIFEMSLVQKQVFWQRGYFKDNVA